MSDQERLSRRKLLVRLEDGTLAYQWFGRGLTATGRPEEKSTPREVRSYVDRHRKKGIPRPCRSWK
jgi:hypothetical protein